MGASFLSLRALARRHRRLRGLALLTMLGLAIGISPGGLAAPHRAMEPPPGAKAQQPAAASRSGPSIMTTC